MCGIEMPRTACLANRTLALTAFCHSNSVNRSTNSFTSSVVNASLCVSANAHIQIGDGYMAGRF